METFFDVAGIGRVCVTAIQLIIAVKNCMDGHKSSVKLLNRAESHVRSIDNCSRELAVLVKFEVVKMSDFCRILTDFTNVTDDLEEMVANLSKMNKVMKNLMKFFTAPERASKLQSVCNRLETISNTISNTVSTSRIDMKINSLLEMMSSVLEESDNPRIAEKRKFIARLPNVGENLNRLANEGSGGVNGIFHVTMAKMLRNQNDGIMNNDKIVQHLNEANKYGVIESFYLLGDMYGNERWKMLDENKAFQYYLSGANGGHAKSMVEVAYHYKEGIGIAQNSVIAFRFFKRASEAGNVDATVYLGNCYAMGNGTKVDSEKAVMCFKEASENGSDAGLFNFGCSVLHGAGIERNTQYAFKLFVEAKNSGFTWAYERLGYCYKYGIGVETSMEKAYENYSKAVELGYGDALVSVGHCLIEGIGVKKDEVEGLRMLRKAARQGCPEAWYRLGYYFVYGCETMERNGVEAFKCFENASNRGSMLSHYYIAEFYERGYVVARNMKIAIRHYKIAASYSVECAQLKLADIYEFGVGIQRNMKQAVDYLFMAANLGNANASRRIENIVCPSIIVPSKLLLTENEKTQIIQAAQRKGSNDILAIAYGPHYK